MTRKTTSKSKPDPATGNVQDFLASSDHPLKSEMVKLRKTILAADPSITEEIKWNAPSFKTTEHFATFNVRARSGIEVVMHFGAKKNRTSETGVKIPDPNSLLTWLAKDRAKITFTDADMRLFPNSSKSGSNTFNNAISLGTVPAAGLIDPERSFTGRASC